MRAIFGVFQTSNKFPVAHGQGAHISAWVIKEDTLLQIFPNTDSFKGISSHSNPVLCASVWEPPLNSGADFIYQTASLAIKREK